VSLLTRAVVWGGADPPVSREDLSNLLEIGTDYELLSAWEKRLLGEVIELSSIEAREVMTARVAAALYDVDKGREGLINLICESRHSKVPVWRADPDNIIGVVYSKDAFLLPERPLESLVRPVLFFPETAKIDYILRTMLSKERTIAMVVDEYGAIEGVVALEDIAEEIVGEIADEYDSPRPRVIRLSQDRYLLSADVTLREWNEMAGSALEDERVETLGGLVAAQLDRLPRKDDSVIAAGYRFTVQRVVNDRLKILLAQKAHAGRRRAGE
jgi:magnesium and cobalt transporter